MKRRSTAAIAASASVAICLVVGVGAQALWSTNKVASVPPMQTGRVQFSAQASDGASVFSYGGSPVTLTVPGSEIAKVIDQVGPNPEPIFWRFSVSGAALGITGLEYDVSASAQISKNGDKTDLASGNARVGTLLANSTLTIYPASANGDCSTIPEVAPTDTDRNVRFVGAQGAELQAPGTNIDGIQKTTEWCAAIAWKRAPDGRYANEVEVTSVGEDGSPNNALDSWGAVVAFPPSLDPVGEYLNLAQAEATGEDGTPARDTDIWSARLFPDPSKEPDVALQIDPAVTNLNPSVPTGDHARVSRD